MPVMTATQQKRWMVPLAYALGFIAISLLQQVTLEHIFWNQIRYLLCFFGYSALILLWAESVQKRVIDYRVRRYLIFIAGFMLLFLLLRTIRWRLPEGYAMRYLWYAYYISILAIPTLFYWVSQYAASSENDIPDGYYRMTAVPTVGLLLLVMTNEMHHWVFHVSNVFQHAEDSYTYGYVYYLILAWIFCLILMSIWTLYRKASQSEAPHRIRQPLMIVGIVLLYCTIYAASSYGAGPRFIRNIELFAAICATTTALWESCICSGLIPGNMDYGWCFNHSTVNAQIVDEKGKWVYHSESAKPLTDEQFDRLKKEGIVREDDKREIALQSVAGGYAAWERDIREISDMMAELEDLRRNVEEATEVLQVQLQVKETESRIRMKDHLRSHVTQKLSQQLETMSELLDAAEEMTPEEQMQTMKKVILLGTYIKRRSNLMLIRPDAELYAGRELELCMHESFENLKRCGIDTILQVRGLPRMTLAEAALCYDISEAVLEGRMEDLQSVSAILQQMENGVQLMIHAQGKGQFHPPEKENLLGAELLYEEETDEVSVILRLRNRGAES